MRRTDALRLRREISDLVEAAGTVRDRLNTLAGSATAELAGQGRLDRAGVETELDDVHASLLRLALRVLQLRQALK